MLAAYVLVPRSLPPNRARPPGVRPSMLRVYTYPDERLPWNTLLDVAAREMRRAPGVFAWEVCAGLDVTDQIKSEIATALVNQGRAHRVRRFSRDGEDGEDGVPVVCAETLYYGAGA